MAFIIFSTAKRPIAISDPEKAIHIWNVLTGASEPDNEQQAEFVAQIERIYLNRRNAPASYLVMYPGPEDFKKSYASTLGVRK